MAKKLSKKKQYRLMLPSKNQLEVTRVVITSQDSSVMAKLTSTCIGDANKAGTYGNGPLAYLGIQNLSESVFVGQSKVDPNRKLAVFKSKGVTQFDSMLNSDNRRHELNQCLMTKASCEFQTDVPASLQGNELTTNQVDDYLRELAQGFNYQPGKKSLRVVFNEKKQQLEIGSATSKRIIVTIEMVESGDTSLPMVVVLAEFTEAQARNLLEAAKLHPDKSLKPAMAASILDLLANFPQHELIQQIRSICDTYPVDDVALLKRDRNKLDVSKLNTKVSYSKNGLNSCIKNLPLLEPDEQLQYAPVFEQFSKELVELAKTHSSALAIVSAIKVSFGYKPSQTVSKAPKEGDDSQRA